MLAIANSLVSLVSAIHTVSHPHTQIIKPGVRRPAVPHTWFHKVPVKRIFQ